MALTVTLLGVSYSIPETNDTSYDAALTSYLKALATAFPQLSGGTSSLTAELDFGTSFGLKALYLKSETVNIAATGIVRLAKTDKIALRNNANSADLALGIDTGDALTFNGANVTGNPMLGANTAAGQSILNGTTAIIVFGTVELDTDSGYNSGTGRYTIPTGKGGHYEITAQAGYATAPGGLCAVQIFKNAAAVKTSQVTTPTANTTIPISATLNLAVGDIIDIRTSHGNVGAQSLIAAAATVYFALKRIPS